MLIFGQKTIDSLGNQMSQFPALCETEYVGDVRQETKEMLDRRYKTGLMIWQCETGDRRRETEDRRQKKETGDLRQVK